MRPQQPINILVKADSLSMLINFALYQIPFGVYAII